MLFSGQSAAPLSIIDQHWLPEVKQNRGHFVLPLIFFLSVSKVWWYPLFTPSCQSLLWAIKSICHSQGVNLQSSLYVWKVSNGEGRNKGTQAPTDPNPLLFGRKRMVGREVLPVDHCLWGLPDTMLDGNAGVLFPLLDLTLGSHKQEQMIFHQESSVEIPAGVSAFPQLTSNLLYENS